VSGGSLWAGRGPEPATPATDTGATPELGAPRRGLATAAGPLAAPRPSEAMTGAPALPARPFVRVRRVRRRLPARPRPLVVDGIAALAGLGLGITLALGIAAESAGSLRADGGIATAAGRLTGLAAAYGMIVVVVLVARCGPLERAVGQDRLVRWHRKLGPWPLYLITAHAVLITVGYAQAAHDGVLHQLGQLLWTYPGILAATVAFALLIAAGVSSYRLARRRLAHETWWAVHLYTYLALFLAFSHQVDTGASFVGHPWARAWWTALWIATLALVVAFRIGLPAWRSLRHRVSVESVEPEGPDTFSVVLRGQRLHNCPPPAASSSSGDSCGRVCGGRRTRTRCRPRPPAGACASRSSTSATTAPRSPRWRPEPGWRSKDRTVPSPLTGGARTACCSSAPAWGSRRSGRCSTSFTRPSMWS